MDVLKASKDFAAFAEEEARARNLAVTVCVIDCHGNVVLKQRMTDAPLHSLELSERKAYTAALTRLRTAELMLLVQPGQPLYTLTSAAGGRFVALGGGIPLDDNGVVVAGLAVSGGTLEEDVAVAEAAFDRLRARLEAASS
jgi:uncharacterized protein GlcG (DUF336 family)